MPAVRITSVWPMASTPTTIVCCITRERVSVWRKRSDLNEKNAIVRTSATNGPTVGTVIARRVTCSAVDRLVAEVGSVVVTSFSEARARSYGLPGKPATGADVARAPVARDDGFLYPQQLARP